MLIGPYPAFTVTTARRKAHELRAQVCQGLDPGAKRRPATPAKTFGDLLDAWRSGALHDGRPLQDRKRSWRDDEQRMRDFLSHWRRRYLDEITLEDVAELHAKIARQRGPYVANRVLSLIGTILRRAQARGLYPAGRLPVEGVERCKELPRQRALNRREARLVLSSIALEASPHWRGYFVLLLMLGSRRAELLSAMWEDFDLESDDPSWRIRRTKVGTVELLELPAQAVEILRSLPRTESPFVFPGAGRAGHVVEPKKAWRAILERAGVADVRVHDLRRTLGAWLASRGVPLRAIARILGHTQVATTARHYMPSEPETQRQALETNAALLLELLPDEGEKGES